MTDDRLTFLGESDIANQQRKQERNSKIVRYLRFILPVLIVALFAVILSWNVIKPEQVSEITSDSTALNIAKNELIRPRFESLDDKGNPYTVTADRASQDKDNDAMIALETPSGEIVMNDTDIIGMNAENGVYNKDTQTLTLTGLVKLAHSQGYVLDTHTLTVNPKTGIVDTKDSVLITGDIGTLKAQNGLSGDRATEVLRFHGPVRVDIKDTGAL